MATSARFRRSLPATFLLLLMAAPGHAAELEASDGAVNNFFGSAVNLSANGTALIGSYRSTVGTTATQGAAYLFRDADTASGTVTQTAILTSSDGATSDYFGYSVSQSGTSALIGAYLADIGPTINQGAAYLFRHTDTAASSATQDLKLISSDGAASDQFGFSVSLSGTTALVGANNADVASTSNQGAAYLFRNIDTASGTITQNVKLIASDGWTNDNFGGAVSLLGSTALVSAVGNNFGQGAAYLFRVAGNATGTIAQSAKLTASDGAGAHNFANSVSLSGNDALVGAQNADFGGTTDRGAAYFFRNAANATGDITENVKLIASDGVANDYFGSSVSLSGRTALVGARSEDSAFNNQGAAYLFHIANDAPAIITERVKITASDAAASDSFGMSVSLSGDNFTIGAVMGDGVVTNSGKAYTGNVSCITTLDTGNTSQIIDGISFTSRDHWIVGQTTSGNQITLTAGDSADVTALGKEVYIGQNAGSDNNTLVIAGTFTANEVNIGSLVGNVGNTLQIEDTAAFAPITLNLAPQNFLTIEGDYADIADLLTYLGTSTLRVWEDTSWTTVDAGNYQDLISLTENSGYTIIAAVPEPSSVALLLGVAMLLFHTRVLQLGKTLLKRSSDRT